MLLQIEQVMEEDRIPQDQDEKEDRKQVIVRKRPGQTPDGMRAWNLIGDM